MANILAQLPPVVESLSGVNLRTLVSRIPGLIPEPASVNPEPSTPPDAQARKTKG